MPLARIVTFAPGVAQRSTTRIMPCGSSIARWGLGCTQRQLPRKPLLTAALWCPWRVGCVLERRGIRPWERTTMADSERVVSTVLDRLVPSSQAVERHSTTIAASSDQVWAAMSQVTTGELRLFRVLMGVRVLPGRLVGSPRARFDADEPLLGWVVRFGFSILGEDVRRALVFAPSRSRGGLPGAAALQLPTARTSRPSTSPAMPRWRPTFGLTPSPAGPSS